MTGTERTALLSGHRTISTAAGQVTAGVPVVILIVDEELQKQIAHMVRNT